MRMDRWRGKLAVALPVGLVLCGMSQLAEAQGPPPNPTQRVSESDVMREGEVPLFETTVVSRTIKAVSYRHRGGETRVDLQGTALLPEARGHVEVKAKNGFIDLDVETRSLQPATRFGPEFLTYVLWAITPEGRASNLGELKLTNGRAKVDVTTDLQAFGMIVTAEPYFAVTQPSDVVVMENIVRSNTQGPVQDIEARYELLKRGSYTFNMNGERYQRNLDPKVPLELYEARNAVEMARATGADRYASDSFRKASEALARAEDYQRRKQGKPIVTAAREAAQAAEDSRLISIERQREIRAQNERNAILAREQAAREQAEQSRREQEAANLAASRARQQQAEAEAERTRAIAEAERARALAEQAQRERIASEQAVANLKNAAEEERRRIAAEAEAARRKAEEAEQARLSAEKAQQELTARLDRERQAAEQERAEMRRRLQEQLNVILETRDSARGLIVNMSDVLFEFGKSDLRPGAREKLAKIAGVLLAHPDLRLEVEGHTDSVGSDEFNQTLSEKRAEAVRGYLTQQGVQTNNVVARGFGESKPVASNGDAAGRQQNRRVEIVVSGESINAGMRPSQPSQR